MERTMEGRKQTHEQGSACDMTSLQEGCMHACTRTCLDFCSSPCCLTVMRFD